MDSWEIAWMKHKGEVTVCAGGRTTRTVPSRRAFRYFAWLSRSILTLAVAVGREADGGEESQPLA